MNREREQESSDKRIQQTGLTITGRQHSEDTESDGPILTDCISRDTYCQKELGHEREDT